MPTVDPVEESKSIIGRTMELGPMFEWNVVVHPRGETYNVLGTPASLCGDILNLTKFESKYGFVAIDTLKVTLEGMNEKGLTISPLIFESASYPHVTKDLKSAEATLCSGALSQYILGKYEKVKDLKSDLEQNKISVFGPQSPEDGTETSSVLTLLRHLARLHWAVDDAHGGHIVIEIVDGVVAVRVFTHSYHNNTPHTNTQTGTRQRGRYHDERSGVRLALEKLEQFCDHVTVLVQSFWNSKRFGWTDRHE